MSQFSDINIVFYQIILILFRFKITLLIKIHYHKVLNLSWALPFIFTHWYARLL